MNKTYYPPVAIIGMACQFPGHACDPETLWNNIKNGIDSIEGIPGDRFSTSVLDHGSDYAKVGGFIDGIENFDPFFFGISPREAQDIDPQQRILLELSWQAMEDAAISVDNLARLKTGVFVGVISHDFERLVLSRKNRISPHTGLGRSTSIAANRISYTFNFTGPSISYDTACSSSLVAVDGACQSLIQGECDVAIAGGANTIVMPESYIEFGRANMLSKSGRCRPFDASADGFVRAEGGGVVLLKLLSNALADRDRIRGVVIATAVNQDGKTQGLMSPSAEAQETMMKSAVQKAEIDATDVGYVEAHGTGTQSGDLAEANSIGRVYGGPAPCWVGSIKSNFGHTEGAAGIAGFIKAVLMIENGKIPPTLHFSCPNPAINMESLGIQIPVSLEEWPKNKNQCRIASVNSFGFGGTNAHAIIRQAPRDSIQHEIRGETTSLLPVSAQSPQSVQQLQESYSSVEKIELSELAWTASRKTHKSFRNAIVCQSLEDLRCTPQQSIEAGVDPKLVFVFCGMGPHWSNSGKELYATEPIFRSTVDTCESIFKELFNISVLPYFRSGDCSVKESKITAAHSRLFALQIALVELWNYWGINPDAVIGHSIGEVTAAYVSGTIALPDAIRALVIRSRILENAGVHGAMCAAAIGVDEALQILDKFPDELFIAAYNSPASVTFSGTTEAIRAVARNLESREVFCRELKIDIPFHSPLIECARSNVLDAVKDLPAISPKIPWFSTVTGNSMQDKFVEASHWWENFRQPVQFSKAVNHCLDSGAHHLLEIAPHLVLSMNIQENLGDAESGGQVLPSLRRNLPDKQTMLATLGSLYCIGFNVHWENVNRKTRIVDVPGIQFDLQKIWNTPEDIPETEAANPIHQNSKTRLIQHTSANSWEMLLKRDRYQWLDHHRIHGNTVFPATGYIEAVLEAAEDVLGQSPIEISEIKFEELLLLYDPECHTNSLNLEFTGTKPVLEFEFHSVNLKREQHHFPICSGLVEPLSDSPPTDSITSLLKQCTNSISVQEFNKMFSELGFTHAKEPYKIEKLQSWEQREVLAKLSVQRTAFEVQENILIDPGLLDLCFRAGTAVLGNNQMLLPVGIDKIRFWKKAGDVVWCHACNPEQEKSRLKFDLNVFDESKEAVLSIQGLALCLLPQDTLSGASSKTDPVYVLEPKWKLQPKNGSMALAEAFSSTEIYDNLQIYSRQLLCNENRNENDQAVEKDLERIAIAYIAEAFENLGFEFHDSQSMNIEEVREALGISAGQEQFFDSLLGLLAKHNFVKLKNGILSTLQYPNSTSGIDVWREVSRKPEVAEYLSELRLIERCGRELPLVLAGEKNGLDCLFPNGSIDELRLLYLNSPTCCFYNKLLCQSIRQIIDHWPYSKPCRILEIGGGTGALLSLLAPGLKTLSVEYTFTDLSKRFIQQAKKRFKTFEFIKFSELNIEADPVIQGYKNHYFDIVICSDTLHTLRDTKQSLTFINELLKPGGFFHFVELTREPGWARLVFGILQGWWNNADSDRHNDTPCKSSSKWVEYLKSTGFDSISCFGDLENSTESAHSLFLARTASEESVDLPCKTIEDFEGKWIVFSNEHEISKNFLKQLTPGNTIEIAAGKNFKHSNLSFKIRPDEPKDYIRLLNHIEQLDCEIAGVVYLWAVSNEYLLGNFSEATRNTPANPMPIAYFLQSLGRSSVQIPCLHVVTANTHSIKSRQTESGVLNSELWGFCRSVRNEYPQFTCSIVDIDIFDNQASEELFDLIHSSKDSLEVAIRGNKHYIQSIDSYYHRIYPSEFFQSTTLKNFKNHNFDNPRFTLFKINQIDDFEVLIEVSISALNFRDIMVALGALPESAILKGYSGKSLGIECAGRVVQSGSRVKHLKDGDRVIALSAQSIASKVVADSRFVFKIPDTLNFGQAAGLLTAYATAWTCNQIFSKLTQFQSVLVHTASGGVGLALIYLLRKYRTNISIFATAGTKEKRDYLYALGIKQVFDSRTPEFANEILKNTHNRGVDAIVNTLAGEMALANEKAISLNGIIIELGKNADSVNQQESTNSKFHKVVVDIDQIWKNEPKLLASDLQTISSLIFNKELPVLPFQKFPVELATDAFRHMSSAKHIGKVLIDFHDIENAILPIKTNLALPADSTYMITGGTRGFGLATAIKLSKIGAKSIILIGKSDRRDSLDFKNALKHFKKNKTNVSVVITDITKYSLFEKEVLKVSKKLPPIRGVIHCAMTIDDCLLSDMAYEKYIRVTKPKITGAWNLHQFSKNLSLDFFVMYSSIASLFGPQGQSAYAASNSFLNSFASYLRSVNVPGISVNWGAVSDYGYVARNPGEFTHLIEKHGVSAISASRMLDHLPALLDTKNSEVIVAGGAWGKETSESNHARLFSEQDNSNEKSFAKSSHDQDVFDCISEILEIEKDCLNTKKSLVDYGIDSLLAVELSHLIQVRLGVRISAQKLQDLTIEEVKNIAQAI